MPSVKLLNQKGVQVGSVDLSEAVFNAEYNQSIIHQVVVAQANNKRQGTKCALTRAEVRGGGIKPWRQKGTGRARQGSTRSPQWTHGGVVFAPKPRDFSQKVNKQIKVAALKSALSQKLRQEEIVLVDKFELAEAKTKLMNTIINDLKLQQKSVLLVLDEGAEKVYLAARNLENVTIIPAAQINVTEIVKNSVCVMTKNAVMAIEEAYNG